MAGGARGAGQGRGAMDRADRLLLTLMDTEKRGMFLALLDDINPATGEYSPDEIPCYVGGVDITRLTKEEREAHEAKIARKKGQR